MAKAMAAKAMAGKAVECSHLFVSRGWGKYPGYGYPWGKAVTVGHA